MPKFIIRTVVLVCLMTFGLILPSYASTGEKAAREAGCLNTYKVQNMPWIVGGKSGEKYLKAAEIENCVCSNSECYKSSRADLNPSYENSNAKERVKQRSALSSLLKSDEEYMAKEVGCQNTYWIQNMPWIVGGESGEKYLKAAEIEKCICSNGECRKR